MPKFEVGQHWKRRDGQIARIIEILPDDPNPVRSHIYSYTADGCFWHDCKESNLDLVELLQEKNDE